MTAILEDICATSSTDTLNVGVRNTVNCLASYRRFRTTDRDVAEAETAKLLSPHRLQLSPTGGDLDAKLSWASLGPVSLYLNDYQSPVSIDRPSQSGYMSVVAPVAGHFLVRHHKQEFVAHPHRGAQAAVSWGDSLHMELSADCAMLSLRAEVAALTEALRNLLPDEDGPLRFESAIINPRSRQAISGTMELMTTVLDNFGSVDGIPSHLRRQLRESALNTVLLTVPHNHSADIFRPRRPRRLAVRQAVELIDSEAIGELTISDIAKHVGVGMRALEIGFQREMQCTPRSFIQTKRMERAHQDLQDADPRSGATVTDIAFRWGFAHTGRFASAYRRRYGVSPSHTLRRLGGSAP
jgi:AraC-like DNA-binding protein